MYEIKDIKEISENNRKIVNRAKQRLNDGSLKESKKLFELSLDFMELTKKEKLKMVRENKEDLASVIEKKRLTERVDLDSNETTEEEIYSSERLWEIVKTNKYDLT